MIVDFPCDFKECYAPVEFIKGQVYRAQEKTSTIYFFRCLNQHYFKKDRKEVGNIQNDLYPDQIKNDEEDEVKYIQGELPFDE